MKSVILIRHAKSSWDFDVDDFDRPLNHRGLTDAPAMAKRLLKKEVKMDTFVSSPAKRALSTASFFAEAYDKKKSDILTVSGLYEPTFDTFYDVIAMLEKEVKTVALFSHNPAITLFANSLTNFTIDDMPTCAVFAIKTNIKKWEEFGAATKEFWFFDYPKSGD